MKTETEHQAKKIITQSIEESLDTKRRLLEHVDCIAKIAEKMCQTIRDGGTVFLFGNGGSAADAQHIAAELIGRFHLERKGLPAIALTVNTSNLTAVANDYGYDHVFSRQLEALLKPRDLAIALSTSGKSESVLNGVRAAKEKGCFTIGFTGEPGGPLGTLVDLCLKAPSTKTPRIQEMHILTGHIVCDIVERTLAS